LNEIKTCAYSFSRLNRNCIGFILTKSLWEVVALVYLSPINNPLQYNVINTSCTFKFYSETQWWITWSKKRIVRILFKLDAFVFTSISMEKIDHFPQTSSYGVHFVVFHSVVLYSHNVYGSLSTQSLRWSWKVFVRMVWRILFVHSTFPLAYGWYGIVILCLIWKIFVMVLMCMEVNWAPPSIRISMGILYLIKISLWRHFSATCLL